jgi:tetratricopeptide (TPR) repeat protein
VAATQLFTTLLVIAITTVSCRQRPGLKTSEAPAPQERTAMPFKDSDNEIIFHARDGRILTRSDLKEASGTFNWEVLGSQGVPAEAKAQHEAGRRAGSSGRSDEALTLFEKAAHLAPQWPYPVYDAAFTYLLKGDDRRALDWYGRTVKLAPNGFFTALTAVQYLRLEAAGKIPRGTYLDYVSLEWEESRQRKRERLEALTKAAPTFAPAWKDLAPLLDDPQSRLSALEAGLKADPDPETRGFLLVNKALLLARSDRKAEGIAILGDVATQANQPGDVQQLALFALKNVTTAP